MQVLNQYKIGTYAGTGAAVSVDCGFKPVYVKIFNETDGDVSWECIQGLADASAYQNINDDTAQQSVISSNGITLSARGFSVGTALSESGKTFRYIAF